jgi:TRAP-type C4-dicarboxylate transport system permease small subunit
MRLKRWIKTSFEAVTAFLITAMIVLLLLQVVGRYALQVPFPWTEELARLAFIYLTFFGSVVAFQRSEHLRVEFFVHALSPGMRRRLHIAVDLASLAVLSVVVWQGVPLLQKFWPILSAALEWPTTLFYFPVVFGCFVLLIYTALDLIAVIWITETPGLAHSAGEGQR